MHFYPEETVGPISEVWQAERWKEFKPSELTPMYSRGLRQFFIDEVAQLSSGEYVIPHDWVIRNGELTSRCSTVSVTPVSNIFQRSEGWNLIDKNTQHGWKIHMESKIVVSSLFLKNYHDILGRVGDIITWEGVQCESLKFL